MDKKIIIEKKKNVYKNSLYAYGVLTLVYLIEKYQEKEHYEECKIILDVIIEQSEKLGIILPKSYSNEFDEKLVHNLLNELEQKGFDTIFYLEALHYYSKNIENEIKLCYVQ